MNIVCVTVCLRAHNTVMHTHVCMCERRRGFTKLVDRDMWINEIDRAEERASKLDMDRKINLLGASALDKERKEEEQVMLVV